MIIWPQRKKKVYRDDLFWEKSDFKKFKVLVIINYICRACFFNILLLSSISARQAIIEHEIFQADLPNKFLIYIPRMLNSFCTNWSRILENIVFYISILNWTKFFYSSRIRLAWKFRCSGICITNQAWKQIVK